MTSVSANSEHREHVGINASFENASENNNTLGVTNINDESRHSIQDGVSESPVQGTQFDRQSHAHHMTSGGSIERHHIVTGVKERHNILTGNSEQIHNPYHMMTGPSNEAHHKCLFENYQKLDVNICEASSDILKLNETRSAVALQNFPSRWHQNDRLNIQQLILTKKSIFEKIIVDGNLDERIQANVRNKTRDSSV